MSRLCYHNVVSWPAPVPLPGWICLFTVFTTFYDPTSDPWMYLVTMATWGRPPRWLSQEFWGGSSCSDLRTALHVSNFGDRVQSGWTGTAHASVPRVEGQSGQRNQGEGSQISTYHDSRWKMLGNGVGWYSQMPTTHQLLYMWWMLGDITGATGS